MPVEFLQQQPSGGSGHATRLAMMYDGSGRRISKTLLTRADSSQGWDTALVTHYTGIGTEIREYKPRNFVRYTDSAGVEHCVSANPDYGGNASTACPLPDTVKAVIPLPQGLGRYGIEDADHAAENGSAQTFEWYLKSHLGSTMLVYGTQASSSTGGVKAAYDYRSFGEQIELTPPSTGKVTENFTGKEKDDETQLDYFGARYLDPMLGLWISVDPMRQFASPYLYAGNGYNPINSFDPDGDKNIKIAIFYNTTETGGEYDAQKEAVKIQKYISENIDMSVNTVQVKAFKEGTTTDLEMTSWLNLGQPDLPAIITHGGKNIYMISDVAPYPTENSTIDFETLNEYLLNKTYLGACYAKDNLDAAKGKYDKLQGPEKKGKTTIEATIDYVIKNADVAPKKEPE